MAHDRRESRINTGKNSRRLPRETVVVFHGKKARLNLPDNERNVSVEKDRIPGSYGTNSDRAVGNVLPFDVCFVHRQVN